MKGQLNVTKSMGGDVFISMSVLTCADGYDEGSADDLGEESEGCRLACGGVPVCHGRIVLCFPLLFKSSLFNLEFES